MVPDILSMCFWILERQVLFLVTYKLLGNSSCENFEHRPTTTEEI